MQITTLVKKSDLAPVSVEDVKSYGRITSVRQDSLIEQLIPAAVAACEQYMTLPIGLATYRATLTYPYFDGLYGLRARVIDPDYVVDGFKLKRAPVVSIEGALLIYPQDASLNKVYTADAFVLSGSDVWLKPDTFPGYSEGYSKLHITYKGGYKEGDTGGICDCPASIQHAVCSTVIHLLDNAGNAKVSALPAIAKTLLKAYKTEPKE